jgi:hypothetical protein
LNFKVLRNNPELNILRVAEIGVFDAQTSMYMISTETCKLHKGDDPKNYPEKIPLQYHLIEPWNDEDGEFQSMMGFRYGTNKDGSSKRVSSEVRKKVCDRYSENDNANGGSSSSSNTYSTGNTNSQPSSGTATVDAVGNNIITETITQLNVTMPEGLGECLPEKSDAQIVYEQVLGELKEVGITY